MPSRQRNYGLIVAAGRGRRFGTLKQFVRIGNRPLLAWSLAAFQSSPDVHSFVVVVPHDRLDFTRRLGRRLALTKLLAPVAGGPTRSASVLNGLQVLPAYGYVAVHDGARPMLTAEMLTRGFAVCRRRGPATYATPVVDAIKHASRGRVTRTVERSGLCAIQTPQFFPIAVLRQAYAAAGSSATDAPDDCALVERLNRHPVVIPGPHSNIKVTTPEDLAIVKQLLCD